MSEYQRYHTITAASQELFHPDCPVYVSRYRLLGDIETDERLLQLRLINLSDKTVRGVFVSVRCIDAAEQTLATLELLPVTGQNAAPGQCFGEKKLLTLWPKRTVFAEILPQRVEFDDGSAWNLETPGDFFAIAPAKPVQQSDPAYARLAAAARRKGVRNDVYFAAQRGVWRCTCGVPNNAKQLRCACCGAERSWLEQNMDPADLSAPAKSPDPAYQLPKLISTPVPIAPIAPEPLVPPELLRPHHAEAPAAEQLVYPAPEPKKHRGGWLIATLIVLLAGAAAAVLLFLMPYLRYMQGVEAQNNGDYERAIAIFSEIEDQRDSAERLLESKKSQALELMGEGDYAEALERFEQLPESDDMIADCLYSLGVLACNDGDPAKGMEYVQQLEERFPDYDNLADLKDNCIYRRAIQIMDQAQELSASENAEAAFQLLDFAANLFRDCPDFRDSKDMTRECLYRSASLYMARENYETAKTMFLALNDYKDSADMATECDYQQATTMLNSGQFYEAQEQFTLLGDYKDSEDMVKQCVYMRAISSSDQNECVELLRTIDDYKDARELRYQTMLSYCEANLSSYYNKTNPDRVFAAYMVELYENGVDGVQALIDKIADNPILIFVNNYEISESFTAVMYGNTVVDPGELGVTINLGDLSGLNGTDLSGFNVGDNAQLHSTTEAYESVSAATNLEGLYIHYRLYSIFTAAGGVGTPKDGVTRILMHYELPDGSTGTAPLNADGSTDGDLPWSRLVPKACEESGSVKLTFYAVGNEEEPLETIEFLYVPELNDTSIEVSGDAGGRIEADEKGTYYYGMVPRIIEESPPTGQNGGNP